jgi:hypothetical protein
MSAMLVTPSKAKRVRQMAIGSAVGVVLALPAFALCFHIAGAGHGSNFAFYVFFGPEWLGWMLLPEKQGMSFVDVWLWISETLGLYGLYGGVLAYARSRRVGVWACALLACLHYGAVLWVVTGFSAADDFQSLLRTLALFSLVTSVATVELFVALHVLAFQYARSTPPYWPRWSWSVGVLLAIGLLAGVTFYAWGISIH